MNTSTFPPLADFSAFASELFGSLIVLNAPDGAAAKFTADFCKAFFQAQHGAVWVIAATSEDAESFALDCAFFGINAHLLPPWETLPGESEKLDLDIAQSRISTLRFLHLFAQKKFAPENSLENTSENSALLITSASALPQSVLPPEKLEHDRFLLRTGDEITPLTLGARLQSAGFNAVEQVEVAGEFTRRGGIMDIFPFFAEQPVRVEFFGDFVETIRFFDVESQMSGELITSAISLIEICPESLVENSVTARCCLTDYLTANTAVIFLTPEKTLANLELYYSGFTRAKNPLFPPAQIIARLTTRFTIAIAEFMNRDRESVQINFAEAGLSLAAPTQILDLQCSGTARLKSVAKSLTGAFTELEKIAQEKIAIMIACRHSQSSDHLRQFIAEKKLSFTPIFQIGFLTSGFIAPTRGFAVISETEITGHIPLRQPVAKKHASPISAFTDLKIGAFVVHITHGIARYEGVKTIVNNGTVQDYLQLLFADEAHLYVPLSHIELVQRYIGGAAKPVLSKLGGTQWTRKKNAAAAAARDFAQELLKIQAARQASPGLAMPSDDTLQNEFNAAFPYEETPDQLTAIAAIKNDQQQSSPMDRLLCGDVGFGKTEVAMRAAFKAVSGGYQVAVLAPTTILAEQHCRVFRERMAAYPLTIASITRFCEPAKMRAILHDLRAGKIDIIIGTHRLLSRDVEFKNLGLAVIDEEQRFGVEQKERLKQFRAKIDVLTMTATPIPRTLNLALLGLRDISNLTTPPIERKAIRTEVVRYNDELVRRVILREITRGGQVFFLHNRVQTIAKIAEHLRDLIPEARFSVAHGRMEENELADAMNTFLNRQSEVLVCTTIIEAGVDIPTVNTLLVHDADHFGLGQLHQLRGRVGRYKYQAHAYFLLPTKRPLSPEAQARLRALEEYSELGAGFRIALRDLEIRGAGNILGSEQSGHIDAVGFELYCRLLEKSVAELRGGAAVDYEPVELDLGKAAYLPENYVASPEQRVEFYRQLNCAAGDDDILVLQKSLRDRYGEIPVVAQELLHDQLLRLRARAAKVNYCGRLENALAIGFTDRAGNDEIAKLQIGGRRISPLENHRWRIALETGESFYAAAEKALAILLDEIAADESEKYRAEKIAELSSRKIQSRKKINPEKNSTAAADESIKKIDSLIAPTANFATELATEKRRCFELVSGLKNNGLYQSQAKTRNTARIFSLQSDVRRGEVKIEINRGDFDLQNFGAVTIICPETRYFLRYTGSEASDNSELINLVLQSTDADTINELTREFWQHKTAELRAGIFDN